MNKTIVILGIDPSPHATGVAVIRYHLTGGCREILSSKTIPHQQDSDVMRVLRKLQGKIDTIAIEKMYTGINVKGSQLLIETARTWTMGAHLVMPDIFIMQFFPNVWRKHAWGIGKLSTEQAKDTAIFYCKNLIGFDPASSEHVCEAIGIAIAGGRAWFNRDLLMIKKPSRRKGFVKKQ